MNQKYGFVDGEYITPYLTTVVHSNKYFEICAAQVVPHAQIVPLPQMPDLDAVPLAIEYISPQLILFGRTFTRDHVKRFLARGFQTVFIFMYSREDYEFYADPKDETSGTVFSPSVTLFGVENFYDYVKPDGVLPAFVMEKILNARFPDACTESEHKRGIDLVNGIYSTRREFGEVIDEILHSWKGFDMEQDMSARGRLLDSHLQGVAKYSMKTHHEWVADLPAASGDIIAYKFAGAAGKFDNYLLTELKAASPTADVWLTYQLGKRAGSFGYKITLVFANDGSTIGAHLGIDPNDLEGKKMIAHWLDIADKGKLLPFL